MTADLRLGPWERVLADVVADCLLVDAPWSKKTHEGHAEGLSGYDGSAREDLPYRWWTEGDVHAFVSSWAPRTRGWFVAMTDDVLAPTWKAALAAEDRVVFPALPYVCRGDRVRTRGDGPSTWTTQIIVARPRTREFASWGTKPGAYVLPTGLGQIDREKLITGGKPLWLLTQLVQDYSRFGDVVVDPCAGAATTLLAAHILGRHGVGAERKREHFNIGRARLAQAGAAA